jgi:hypothetical protein
MTKELFNALLKNHIGAWLLSNGRPGSKVILMDGDGSHEPHLQTIQWLLDNDIELFRLPPNLTQYLCPLDANVFVHLKHDFRDLMRRAMHGGAVSISVADRWHLMDVALSLISPRIVTEGWRKSSLYPLDDDMWKREKWAETSVPFASASRSPEHCQVRRSLRIQLKALGHDLLDAALPMDQKLDRVRQCARANPSDSDIVQAALPRPQTTLGTRRRGRLVSPEMVCLTGEDAMRIAGERDARAAVEKQRAMRRARKKETISKVKRLVQAAEEASARAARDDDHDGSEAQQRIEEAKTAKRFAMEAVRTHEAQGDGKTYALKAKRLIKLADRRVQALEARCQCRPPAIAEPAKPADNGTGADAAKENEPPAPSTGSRDCDCAQGRRRSSASAASKGSQARTTIAMLRA